MNSSTLLQISVMFSPVLQYEKHLKPITMDTEKKPYGITCVPLLVKRNGETTFLSNDATLSTASIVSGTDKRGTSVKHYNCLLGILIKMNNTH